MVRTFSSFIFIMFIASGCGPRNQESCLNKAAQEAKNEQALQIMSENCYTEFPASKDKTGKYTYYDAESETYFEVKGPKLTESEWDRIEEFRKKKIQRDLEESEKKIENAEKLTITHYDISCNIDDTYIKCYDKNITVRLRNDSDKTIGGITFQYEIGRGIDCSGALSKRFYSNIDIPPNGNASIVQNVKFTDAGPDGVMSGCVRLKSISRIE